MHYFQNYDTTTIFNLCFDSLIVCSNMCRFNVRKNARVHFLSLDESINCNIFQSKVQWATLVYFDTIVCIFITFTSVPMHAHFEFLSKLSWNITSPPRGTYYDKTSCDCKRHCSKDQVVLKLFKMQIAAALEKNPDMLLVRKQWSVRHVLSYFSSLYKPTKHVLSVSL